MSDGFDPDAYVDELLAEPFDPDALVDELTAPAPAAPAPSPIQKGASAVADAAGSATTFGGVGDAAKRVARAAAKGMTGGIFDPIDLATGKTSAAAREEIRKIVEGGPAMVRAFREDPAGALAKLPGAMAGSMMETYAGQLEGKPMIQSDRPLASTGDVSMLVPAAKAAAATAGAASRGAGYIASKTPGVKAVSPAVVTEKVGRGMAKRAKELRAERLERAALDAKRTASKLEDAKKGEAAWSEAVGAEAKLGRLQKQEAADAAIQATKAAEKEFAVAKDYLQKTKELRAGRDPMIAKSASGAAGARTGLADEIMKIDESIRELQYSMDKGARTMPAHVVETNRAMLQQLKAERARFAAEHMGNLRKAIATSPDTPRVEAARRGMYDARRAAREAGEVSKPIQDSYRQQIAAAQGDVAAKALARDVAEESLQAQKVAQQALAGRQTSRAMTARKGLEGAPPSLTNWALRRLNRIVPGEREVLSESALAMGGGGARGTILATALHGVGEWAASPARVAATARRLIESGRSAQDIATVLTAMKEAASTSGRAGAVAAARAAMDSGQLSAEDAADLVEATVR